MKNVLLLLIVISFQITYSQTEIPDMNDCEFFELIKQLKDPKTYVQTCKNIYSDINKKREFIRMLEKYIVLSGSLKISPMYLEESSNKFACEEYVNQYMSKTSNRILDYKQVQDKRAQVQRNNSEDVRDLLIDLLDLNKDNNELVLKNTCELSDSYVIELLLKELDTNKRLSTSLSTLTKEENKQFLIDRMNDLDAKEYMYYEAYSSKPNGIKGFEMYHDNDFFMFPWGMNQDREYTGGFKFTIITDYLKWRFFRLCNKKEENVLTYQTVSIGGSGYTPYIRYRNNFVLADSLHKHDRPFASNVYIERSKHRTWRHGLVRQKGEFQIGGIGMSQGRKIQAKLHEDVIYESQHVYGWEKQIANGGRLIVQTNQKWEFLLFSNTNQYKSIFCSKTVRISPPLTSTGQRKYSGINVSLESDVRLGTLLTSTGLGLRFSTLDFLNQSGTYMIKSKPLSRDQFGIRFDFGLNYRYVIHNTMLEGLGLFKTFPKDPYDKVNSDFHTLSRNQIKRNMLVLDWGISVRFRKTTIFFRQNFHTLEYKSELANVDYQQSNLTSLVASEDIGFYNNDVVREQKSFLNYKIFGTTIYGYGTLGISWLIE
jgi:hypothetical protein